MITLILTAFLAVSKTADPNAECVCIEWTCPTDAQGHQEACRCVKVHSCKASKETKPAKEDTAITLEGQE